MGEVSCKGLGISSTREISIGGWRDLGGGVGGGGVERDNLLHLGAIVIRETMRYLYEGQPANGRPTMGNRIHEFWVSISGGKCTRDLCVKSGLKELVELGTPIESLLLGPLKGNSTGSAIRPISADE